jgi:hypothetical protein
MDTRTQEIIAQVAVKGAVELIGSAAFAETTEEQFAELLQATATIVYDTIVHLATPSAVAVVQAQFPGAEVVPSNVVPISSGPAPVPGVASGSNSSDEAKWQRYFANPSGYYDNRGNKTNPKSPDFKAKVGGRDAEALWINSKGTPGWVYARFGQANPANEAF